MGVHFNMDLRCHFSIVFYAFLLRTTLCTTDCENGYVTDSLIQQDYSEDECLLQTDSKHCYKPIESGGGLCYLAREETVTHKGEDCDYHLPIIYESENITIAEDYLNQAFSGPLETNGTSLEKAFKICQLLNCYMVLYDESTNRAYFMLEPSKLRFSESGISFGANRQHYKMYFEPRCEATEPQGRVTVEHLCRNEDPLPANWEFRKGLVQSYNASLVTDIDQCKNFCNPNGPCNKTMLYFKSEDLCITFETKEIFDTDSVIPDSGSRLRCIVVPAEGGKFRPRAFSFIRYLVSVEPRYRVTFPEQVNTHRQKNYCWDLCSKYPWCHEAHLVGPDECFLYDGTQGPTLRNKTNGERVQPIYVMSGKIYTDEGFCDKGGIAEKTMFGRNFDERNCDFFSLCYRVSGVEGQKKGFCYVGGVPPDPIPVTRNCEVQPFFYSLPDTQVAYSFLDNKLQFRPEGNQSYEACFRICSLDENCYGLTYFPSTEVCAILEGPITLPYYSYQTDFVDCQMAFEVPHCPACFQRVEMGEQIVFKDQLQCSHTYQESCSDVYKTIFKTQEVEECKESFVKNCHIEYEMVPRSEKVEVCHSPLTRDCNQEGPETCSTEHETVCATTYHENEVADDVVNCTTVKEDVCDSDGDNCRMVPRQVCQVESMSSTKLTPETDCHQESREVCGPEICPIVQGDRICVDELKTLVQEVPQEKCQISPKTICNMIHKIVPKLEMSQECIEVPQEICQTVQVEAKKEQFPIIKSFCPPADFDPDSADDDNTIADSSSSQSNGTRSAGDDDMSPMEATSTHLLDNIASTTRGSRRNSKSGSGKGF